MGLLCIHPKSDIALVHVPLTPGYTQGDINTDLIVLALSMHAVLFGSTAVYLSDSTAAATGSSLLHAQSASLAPAGAAPCCSQAAPDMYSALAASG